MAEKSASTDKLLYFVAASAHAPRAFGQHLAVKAWMFVITDVRAELCLAQKL